MNEVEPSPQEARAALSEARDWAARVRRTDRQFGQILAILAATYLAAGVLVGLSDRGGRTLAGLAVVVILVGALGGGMLMIWRIRAYSRSGQAWFAASCAAFTIWNAAVAGVSSASGWWGFHQPASHFTVSAAVGAAPLIVAAWLIGRKH
jgi:uncharacterized protein involved in response to NO